MVELLLFTFCELLLKKFKRDFPSKRKLISPETVRKKSNYKLTEKKLRSLITKALELFFPSPIYKKSLFLDI